MLFARDFLLPGAWYAASLCPILPIQFLLVLQNTTENVSLPITNLFFEQSETKKPATIDR
jgi:hypothetical protein